MDKLQEQSACHGLLPLNIGGVRVTEMALGALTSLSPFGDGAGFAQVLREAHGMAVPKPNRATGKEGARCIWFGLREVLLVGPAPDAALSDSAAVVDVTDGWAAVCVEGARGAEVLARLVPVDLREAHFKRGHTARTQVGHMTASLTRLSGDRIVILVFRSMAGTLVQEVRHALEAVAARR